MEEVLDIYKKPYDAQCPQVCIDEMSTQLIGEVRAPRVWLFWNEGELTENQ